MRRDLETNSSGSTDYLAALADILHRDARRRRELFAEAGLGDPVWNMLLALFVAGERAERPTTSSVCLASGTPLATAHRHLQRLETLGIVTGIRDRTDHRRVHVRLSDVGRAAMAGHLELLLACLCEHLVG